MSPYRNAPPPPSVRRLRPWKSKGPWLFVGLCVLCTAWVYAPRTAPVAPPRARFLGVPGPDGNVPLTVTWGANIDRSGIPDLELGTACEITAELAAREGPLFQKVIVRCGGRTLYRSTPSPATRQSLTQRYGTAPGTIVFEGSYDDGMPAGPRLRLDTTPSARAAVGARGTAHVSVGFGIDEGVDLAVLSWSEPRMSPLIGAYASAAFDRPARVLSATGKGPVPTGTTCRMQVIPVAADRCDATLECRPTAPYTGTFRSVSCNASAAAAGAPLTIDDAMDRPPGQTHDGLDTHGSAVLHFDSISRPFSITTRVPEMWMLQLTLTAKLD